MVNLNDMSLFAHVVDAGSFTSAAKVTQIPKSTVSRRISNLETSLGTRLLERTTRRFGLTEIGKVYYQHCRRMIEEAESAEISVSQLLGKPKGCLRINTTVTIGQHLLSPLISDFLLIYPDIDIQLLTTNRVVNLIDEGFDVALRVGSLADSSLISKYLGTTQLKCYASPDYLQEMGEPETPDHLIKHRCITMSNNFQIASWRLQNKKNIIREAPIKSKAIVYDFMIARELIIKNMGIGMLPKYLFKDKPFSSMAQIILPSWSSPNIELHAIYQSRRGMTPKLRVFLDFLSEKFKIQNLFDQS